VETLRHQRRLTLEQLATSAGTSKGFLSEIEHGLALPSLTTLARVAEQLGVALHELVRLPPAKAAKPAKAKAPAKKKPAGRAKKR
jgi:transcriptional regulator with XRE-family HTH domain